MLVISLDESGTFEGKGSPIKIIAGLIYQDEEGQTSLNEEENFNYVSEKLRIEQFLIRQCKLLDISYPEGIHAMDMSDRVKKRKLKEALKQYLKERGRYHFTLIIKSNDTTEESRELSNLVNEKEASNLYELMLWQLLSNILFHNDMFAKEKQVVLEVATRSVPVANTDTENLLRYKRLGYSNTVDKRGNTIFYLTDQRSVKSALSTKMVEADIHSNIIFDINVQSINYHRTVKDQSRDTTPWLYIADLTCDIIRDYLRPNREDFCLDDLYENAVNITGNKPLIWVYDDIDEVWADLYRIYENRNYIKCQEAFYKFYCSSSTFKEFYERHWLEGIRDKIDGLFNINDILNYLDAIKDILGKDTTASGHNDKNVSLGVYLGEKIWDQVNVNYRDKISPKIMYKLCDLMLLGYNHNGNIERAKYFYDQCRELRLSVEPEDFCGTLLSAAQLYANKFQFEAALEVIRKDEVFVEKIKESKNLLRASYDDLDKPGLMDNNLMDNNFKYDLLGKVYSSQGQFYGFMQRKDEALRYFEKALKEFESPSFNRLLTVSFILHLALEFKDKVLYDTYVSEYLGHEALINELLGYGGLGHNHLEKQLDFIVDRHDPFRLFVFLKAINTFDFTIDDILAEKLKSTEEAWKLLDKSAHPWELIYKHLAILFSKRGDRERAKFYYEKIGGSMKLSSNLTLTIISLICQSYVAYYYIKDFKEADHKINTLRKAIENDAAIRAYFEDCFMEEDLSARVDRLYNKLCYSYS